MERYILHIFIVNWVLVIADAVLGYHVAPLLTGMRDGASETGGQLIRRLLPAVVALYMFFNCLAYFRENLLLLLLVSGIVFVDIAFQLVVRWKIGRSAR
jgi:hypothetical protein